MTLEYEDLKVRKYFIACEEQRNGYYGPSPAEYDFTEEESRENYDVDDERVVDCLFNILTRKKEDDFLKDEFVKELKELIKKHLESLYYEYWNEVNDYFRTEAEESVEVY